ncbi:substrate-binding domain-containing protein [Microbacterium flavescens]|uniref:substrate-binding domain-containing protein n=1 Tax=Microbacterium flavescens TaxID=69366 RepID=UPI001BDEB356|nr:substrate-binding domain-containing protein [Microbacterium flavescens]
MVRVQSYTPADGNTPTRAAVRAAQQRKRSLILLGVILLLVVALVVVLGVIFVRGSAGAPPEEQSAAGECLPTSLRITADPAVAGALEAIVEDLAGSRTDCPAVTIQAEDSALTAAALTTGAAPEFDVWVPDSTMWPERAAGQAELAGVDAADLVVSGTVASTPVVFAATEPTAAALESEGAGFASLAGQSVAAVLPDPSTVASSSAALLALQTAVGGDARVFTALSLGLEPGVVSTAAEALDAASAAPSPTIAVTTEQAVLTYGEGAETPLVPVYPTDVKPAVSVPVVTLADASDETLEAAEALTTAVAAATDRLAEHGLRDAAGNALDATAADAEDARVSTDPADGVNHAGALRTWQKLTAPSRMIALNDVSGSMNQPATADMRRIDLFEQAAVRAINSLSADSSIANWVFSSRRIGAQDWQEIVPFGELGDPAHKQRMIDSANSLDSLVGGGTGLYDSVLAAVSYLRETYVPGQVNLVLLNTDGFNEDDDGLDLPGLLAELAKLHDPAKPVAVIAIGYGPDTDQAALEQIAAATDGAAYQALKPTDIGTVLIDAVTQRGCRPNCG